MFNVWIMERMSQSVKANRDAYELDFYGQFEILML